jgi:hypothetical protein
MSGCSPDRQLPQPRQIIPAMSTPLASIFGSGFLVIVPVLASGVGPYAILAMLAISVVALQTGAIVRHNILCAEPVLAAGNKRLTVMLERGSDIALVLAYIVSVCLYLHILSAFVLGSLNLDSEFNKSLLTSIVAILITLIGMLGGLAPLGRLEQFALYMTLAVVLLLVLGFARHDAELYIELDYLPLLEMPERYFWEVLTIVSGTLIVVQGFATPRYLGAVSIYGLVSGRLAGRNTARCLCISFSLLLLFR